MTKNIINHKRIFNVVKKVTASIVICGIVMSSTQNIINAALLIAPPNSGDVVYNSYGVPVSDVAYNAADNSLAFPESYKQYIRNLKSAHPNWTFKAVYNKLDWYDSLSRESYEVNAGISLVPSSFTSNWKKDGVDYFKDGTFVIASKNAVAYTLDPRNFLNDSGIFQFEALDYNASTSTETAIDKIIYGTEMSSYPTQYKKSGNMVTLENSLRWSQLIIAAAKDAGKTVDANSKGLNAVFLASRMKQETSLKVLTNSSINGSYSGYEGLYNFFNIGATPNADGSGSMANGLSFARNSGWTNPEASIRAGATYIWKDYIRWGQNTVYFQKFDVSNIYENAKFLYRYQYMTNILAPSSEAKITYNSYLNAGLLESNFEFYIPVYENMPSVVSPHPESEFLPSVITGTDIIYLDDKVENGADYFNVRSGPGLEYNTISQIVESSSNVENRRKFTRVQVGTSGYDKIILSDGTSGYVSQSYVQVYNYTKVTGITLNSLAVNLKTYETYNLVPTISPNNAYIKNVTYASSNNAVATVDSSGKITAKTVGSANITAITLDGNKVATCIVTVGTTLATSISANSEYPLIKGNYLTLTPTFSPANTTDKSYDITIADTTIATVENGKIKGLKVGNTNVTIKTKDTSNKTATFLLKVLESVATISNYTVDDKGTITKVPVGTTVLSLKNNVTSTYTKRVVNAAGEILADTAKIGTGSKIQLLNETDVIEEKTIVIYGDITGDGNVNSSDLLKIRKHMLGLETLTLYSFSAGNISKTDTVINSLDLLKLKQHMLGTVIIVQ